MSTESPVDGPVEGDKDFYEKLREGILDELRTVLPDEVKERAASNIAEGNDDINSLMSTHCGAVAALNIALREIIEALWDSWDDCSYSAVRLLATQWEDSWGASGPGMRIAAFKILAVPSTCLCFCTDPEQRAHLKRAELILEHLFSVSASFDGEFPCRDCIDDHLKWERKHWENMPELSKPGTCSSSAAERYAFLKGLEQLAMMPEHAGS